MADDNAELARKLVQVGEWLDMAKGRVVAVEARLGDHEQDAVGTVSDAALLAAEAASQLAKIAEELYMREMLNQISDDG